MPFDLQSVLLNIEESVKVAFDDFQSEFKDQLIEITTTSRVGVPAVEIKKFVEENGIDLIVMGTHGWTGFRHLILGSTAENVVRTAKCPVLTVKSSETGA